ncbi:MAG: ABC transporter ATP-binding protein/permease [Bifidobacteriaceae bacterium]|jgi:ATP-binding cassette subfamily B protein|nr:ABC transporter ATP-binding protein/permease [Bifidobacteriaceae bacterium]
MSARRRGPASSTGAPQAVAARDAKTGGAAKPVGPPGGRGPRGGPMGGHGMAPGEKSLNFKASGKRLLGMLRPERIKVALVLVLSMASVGLGVLGPKLLGRATNEVFAGFIGSKLPAGMPKEQVVEGLRQRGQNQFADMVSGMDLVPGQGVGFETVGRILAGVLAVYVASALLAYAQGLIATGVIQRVVYRMRRDVEAKLGRLPLAYYDRQPRGEILSRVTNDIDNVAQTLQQTMSQLLNAVFTLLGVLIMMLTISPLLTLVAVFTVPVAGVLTAVIAKRSQPQFIRQWAATGDLNSHIEEMYTGHELVKVFGEQAAAEAEFHRRNADLNDSSFKAQFISGIIQPSMMFVSNLGYVVIAVVGGLRVASGTMSLGDVQAFIQYSRQFTQPITQVASMMNLLQSGVASAERVFDLLDAAEMSPDPARPERPASPVEGRVDFRDVTFSYDPDTPLIEDLDLTAAPGRSVAIVGPTGAGKTTLVNLVMRFYEIGGGAITLDGVDARSMTREGLRSNIGMVLQDTWLFNGTIFDNIAYGKLDATEEEVMAAAKATYVDRFVRALPDGYATVVDEEGSNISAGEKQLLTIARAFLADRGILILDEATSSVDTRTELLVQKAMNKLRAGRTSFVIAHRLSTIRDADVILVMEHGAIVEQGNHAELIAKNGEYAKLYRSQFAGAAAQVD